MINAKMKYSLVVFVAILLSLLTGLTVLHAFLPVTCPVEVGRWAHGPSLTVSANSTLGIYGSGAVLRAVDLSTPAAPVILGEITMPDVVYGAELEGRYAFVAAGEADLRVIDLIDPSNPTEVGSASYGSQNDHIAVDVILHGDLAFVLGKAGVTLYDISLPTSPVEQDTYPYDGNHDPADLSINGNRFVVCFDDVMTSTIYFVDFSDPDNLEEICAYTLVFGGQHYNPTGLVWHGNHVYVSEHNDALFTIDASDPASPQAVWTEFQGGGLIEMVVVGDSLVASHRLGSMRVFDISIPARPDYITWLDGLVAGDLWPIPSSSYVMVSGRRGGFDVVDLSTPATPSVATHVLGIGSIEDLVVTGSTGMVVSGALSPPLYWPPSYPLDIASIRLTQPGSATVVDKLFDTWAKTLDVRGDHAFAPTSGGFKVIDISDPANLVTVGSCPGNTSNDVSISGDVGIQASGSVAQALDLSVLTAPAVGGVCDGGSSSALQTELAGQHAHVTFGISSFDLVTCDVSNPAAPFVTSTIDLYSNDPSDLLVVRNHLVMTNESQIRTFDLADPSLPSADGSLSLTGNPDQMAAVGNLLFVTDDSYYGNLMVIDIGDLSNPSLICTIPTVERPTAISQSGGLIYVGFTHTGLQVFGYPDVVFADDFERGDTRHWE
jgi:hypothetical protein